MALTTLIVDPLNGTAGSSPYNTIANALSNGGVSGNAHLIKVRNTATITESAIDLTAGATLTAPAVGAPCRIIGVDDGTTDEPDWANKPSWNAGASSQMFNVGTYDYTSVINFDFSASGARTAPIINLDDYCLVMGCVFDVVSGSTDDVDVFKVDVGDVMFCFIRITGEGGLKNRGAKIGNFIWCDMGGGLNPIAVTHNSGSPVIGNVIYVKSDTASADGYAAIQSNVDGAACINNTIMFNMNASHTGNVTGFDVNAARWDFIGNYVEGATTSGTGTAWSILTNESCGVFMNNAYYNCDTPVNVTTAEDWKYYEAPYLAPSSMLSKVGSADTLADFKSYYNPTNNLTAFYNQLNADYLNSDINFNFAPGRIWRNETAAQAKMPRRRHFLPGVAY